MTSSSKLSATAAAGESYLNPRLGARIASEPPPGPPDDLSKREVEVLRLIALGHTNAEIAEQLFLSVRTVETHRSHIQQKLRLSTPRGAGRLRARTGSDRPGCTQRLAVRVARSAAREASLGQPPGRSGELHVVEPLAPSDPRVEPLAEDVKHRAVVAQDLSDERSLSPPPPRARRAARSGLSRDPHRADRRRPRRPPRPVLGESSIATAWPTIRPSRSVASSPSRPGPVAATWWETCSMSTPPEKKRRCLASRQRDARNRQS